MDHAYCNVAFTIDPKITVEDLLRSIRQLGDCCDVDLSANEIQIDYDCNGQNPVISVVGDMLDTPEHWKRLVDSMPDITGFEIDEDAMLEWVDDDGTEDL